MKKRSHKISVLTHQHNKKILKILIKTEPCTDSSMDDSKGIYHPFSLITDHNIRDQALRDGEWTEYVADNGVTRALIEMIQDEKALKAKCGSTYWTYYRARLISLLDQLWD